MKDTFVIALGGNAIIKAGQTGTIDEQYQNIDESCGYIAKLVEDGYNIILTHGNGPQIGNLLIQKDMAKEVVPTSPIDICVGETQGQLGYMINQTLINKLNEKGIKKSVITVLTQIIVDAQDEGFKNPTKPIGPFYNKEEADNLTKEKGYQMIEDSGRGYRRVVASPRPIEIIETDVIKAISKSGSIVIAGGGGGIPVIEKDGKLIGTEAVIDKDFASGLLASSLNIDTFIILTGVDQVAINFGKENQKELYNIKKDELIKYQAEGHFPSGSMGPKVSAAIEYLQKGGKKVIITSMESLEDALKGKKGTIITN